MKILYTNFHDGDGGGHTTYLIALARGLRARHEIHLALPPSSRAYREAQALDDVRTHAQPFPNGLKQWAAQRAARKSLRALLERERFDIVHVNGSADHRLVLSALRGLNPRPKLVWTKHNSKPVGGLGHWWRARRTDLAIAVSEATRRELLATPYARCAPVTVRNGIDTARFAPMPAEAAGEERDGELDSVRWRLAGDVGLLLGSNAGTADYKGWMDLIEALSTLPDAERAKIHVLLCGKPPSETQRARIDALELTAQMHFAGMLDDVRPAIAAIDAGFVLSYAVETISFACREMMAMGKPVLVSDYAGLPENIDHGIDGWVVKTRDIAAIAQALRTILERRNDLPAMGDAARAKAVREFDLSQFVDGTEAAYRNVLSPN
ncbi:MAG: glycosyltransferase family 4 protein [Xanthomonadaceae bacterium]|nr:glycosyltransferase family 4 protein [Xanthomonadaceae bacterium]